MVEATLLKARKLMAIRSIGVKPQRKLNAESCRQPVMWVGANAGVESSLRGRQGIVLQATFKSRKTRDARTRLARILSGNKDRLEDQGVSVILYRYRQQPSRVYLAIFGRKRVLKAAERAWLGEQKK